HARSCNSPGPVLLLRSPLRLPFLGRLLGRRPPLRLLSLRLGLLALRRGGGGPRGGGAGGAPPAGGGGGAGRGPVGALGGRGGSGSLLRRRRLAGRRGSRAAIRPVATLISAW